MRIQWHSNAPWAPTGYGNQTRLFVPRIQKLGYPTNVTAFYGLQGVVVPYTVDDQPFRVYHGGRKPYGSELLIPNAVAEQADILISLIDAWVIPPELFSGTPVKWVPWFPVDCEPMQKVDYQAVKQAYRRIVFSKFAEREMEKAGLDCYYVPHGVDTKAFRPVDRVMAREYVGWPADRYVVGMVAANRGYPTRKAFHEQIAGFAAFRKLHPDALLYLHTDDGTRIVPGDPQIDLVAYLGALQLPYAYAKSPDETISEDTAVLFCDQYTYFVGGFNDDYMNAAYNAMDVHMLVSAGEGFGIPLIEAQAAGCPVIVGDWTAMPELCFSGWKVDKRDAKPFWNAANVFQYYANPEAIAQQLENAYRVRGNVEYRNRARQGALRYDADKVTEKYWKPVLEEIEADVKAWIAPEGIIEKSQPHQWAETGLYNSDGSMSVPAIRPGDYAELRIERDGKKNVIANGFDMVVNGIDLSGLDDGTGTCKIVAREIGRDYGLDLDYQEGDVVIDIGAHVGLVTYYLAKKYPQVMIYAYEPEPGNYANLKLNIAGLDNVKAFNLAVTGDGRVVAIHGDAHGNSGGAGLYASGDVLAEVESITLKQIMADNDIQNCRLLKIDCEGAEFEILKDIASLSRVDAIRGEFHRGAGDAEALLRNVREIVPDSTVTLQGALAKKEAIPA